MKSGGSAVQSDSERRRAYEFSDTIMVKFGKQIRALFRYIRPKSYTLLIITPMPEDKLRNTVSITNEASN